MLRKGILLLIVLIVAVVAIVKIAELFKSTVVEADATKFVLEDLHSKYPTADIEIISTREVANAEGGKYFEIKAKVTEQPATPCPERMHIFYNYPVQNFVPQPPEIITSNCMVCHEPGCILVFPEEAVIASHTFPGTNDVHRFITDFADATPTVTETADGWRVMWDSPDSSYYYTVEIMKDSSVGPVERVQKE